MNNLYNLQNIHYCLLNGIINVKLLLGWNDLNIMKIYKMKISIK